MAEVLSNVSMISYILAIVFAVISVILWIKFRILEVIGDLSGRTARKSITKMREMNEKSGVKFYPTNLNTEKETIHSVKEGKKGKECESETGVLYENKAKNISISAQTGLLAAETVEIANTNETSELELMHEKNDCKHSDKIEEIGFELIEEIILIHTEEVIV